VKVAIVGGGVAGLVVAHLLSPTHDVTLFEADDRLGGHAHTIDVELGGRTYAVDTGFVVYDPETYPGFAALLDRLGVATQPSEMSFSVRCAASGLEYGGGSLGGLFAQPRNLVSPAFHRLLRDVLRFNREAPRLLDRADADPSVEELVAAGRYSAAFRDRYLVPMAAAIWSAPPARVLDMPARHLVAFFRHHGLLRVRRRPQWRTVTGGARRYVEALAASCRDVRLRSPVTAVRRHADRVDVRTRAGTEAFDRVVLATHAGRTLALLADPTRAEREVLGAFTDQENDVVVHTDASLLPASRRAWAAWNVHLDDPRAERVAVTYDMRRLQRLAAPEAICVTLNATAAVDPAKVVARMVYHHPVYSRAAIAAQRRRGEIDGAGRTHYCGASWGRGFHEDGVASALAVGRRFGVSP
jgi:uncharacterized protein